MKVKMMKQKICKPDYSNSLVNLANSILKYFGAPTKHTSLQQLDDILQKNNSRTVVLLVLDGMGMDMLEHNLPQESFLRRNIVKTIYSVYPPTTAAATTSVYSGMTPCEHGWAGWQCYFKEYNRNIELFSNKDYYYGGVLSTPAPEKTMGYKRLYNQVAEAGNAEGYGVCQFWGNFEIKDFDDICHKIEKLSHKDEKKFIMAYWKNPDATMHYDGCYGQETLACLKSLNNKLETMAESLENTTIIITADHGLIDIKKSVLLNEIKEIDDCLRVPPAVEPRTCVFYVKDGKGQEFEQAFNRHFADDYMLMTSDEYMKQGIGGDGKVHPRFREFMGDYVALAIGDIILQYKCADGKEPMHFEAHHAGMTEKEMIIPMIVYQAK